MQSYILENEIMRITVLDYGARITEIYHKALRRNLVLSYATTDAYRKDVNYLCATIGPNANRLAQGVFFLDGKKHEWDSNDGKNNLHSGKYGLDHVEWKGAAEENRLRFFTTQEKPFLCTYEAVFTLEDETLSVEYFAAPEEPALLNLTNHTYFRLDANETVLDYTLQLYADFYTPFEETGIPTGEVRPVKDSCFDFRKARTLRAALAERAKENDGGYDHNFVCQTAGFSPMAVIGTEELTLQISSTAPAFQLYTANNFIWQGKQSPFAAICIEPQYIPNSINIPYFAQPVYTKAHPFYQKNVYAFAQKAH